MKTSTLLRLLALAGSTHKTSARALERREDTSPQVFKFDIERQAVRDPVARDRSRLRRRDDTVGVVLDNEQTLYFLNASLGTPPQTVRLHLDTGSSDLWLNTPDSRLCRSRGRPCGSSGTYSANSSSTYKYINSDFNISYVDGSGASGDYVADTLQFGGENVTQLQFGIGYISTSEQNVLGIGYRTNEVQVARAGMPTYDNLPAKLVADGMTGANAYSLWLNDLDASTGSVLFGGVDTARFGGSLVSVPVQQVDGMFIDFVVTMTGMTLGSTTVASNEALGVLLDSGSSLTYLPDDMVKSLYNQVNATYQQQDGVAFVPCSLAEQDVKLSFKFSSPAQVDVPLREMVLDPQDVAGQNLNFDNGVPACLFGIVPAGNASPVLGDTFLRSAYVVYDLDNNQIALANTKFNVSQSASNVVAMTKGESAVPSATKAGSPVTATAGAASGGKIGQTRKDNGAMGGLVPSCTVVVVAAALFGILLI